MAVKRLIFDKEHCIGCQLCTQTCSGIHEDEYVPEKARLKIDAYYENRELCSDSHICILCGICAGVCEAITMVDKITIDSEKCNGCGKCAERCPQNVITVRDDKAVICDLCGGSPMCTVACPHGALRYA